MRVVAENCEGMILYEVDTLEVSSLEVARCINVTFKGERTDNLLRSQGYEGVHVKRARGR